MDMIQKYNDIMRVKKMITKVAKGLASPQEDKIIYNMFGNLSKGQAEGMVMGIEACLNELDILGII